MVLLSGDWGELSLPVIVTLRMFAHLPIRLPDRYAAHRLFVTHQATNR
jgi:hypothetical protein